jgi:hypothetical protein
LAGEYAPYEGAHVVVVTSAELKKAAAQSQHGGFGAGQRVAVTKVGETVQVAYANPRYWAAAFRMSGNLESSAQQLAKALGAGQPFGSKDGLMDKELRGYHYMFMMPYFDDLDRLGRAANHREMLAAVEAGLAAGKGKAAKIYRIDIPGKEETVFGVAIGDGIGGDKSVMGFCDFGPQKHTAHLPYEFLVVGDTAYALNGKFRIATSFPDLTMGTFLKINDAPDFIRDTLSRVASGKP